MTEFSPQKTLVLFDFDGTLTKGDTLSRFILFSVPPLTILTRGVMLFFRYLSILWRGEWSNARGKEELLSIFFKGKSKYELEQLGDAFCWQQLPALLRPALLSQLRAYRKAGARIAVVSASVDVWLKRFCEEEGIILVCTCLEYEDGVFTGKLASVNCNGHEKAVRIRLAFDLASYEKIIVFGNSAGDAEMFALSNEAWFVGRRGIVAKYF